MLLLFVLICQDVFASDSYYRIPPKTTIEPSQLNGARKIIAENFSTLYITIMGAVDYRTPENCSAGVVLVPAEDMVIKAFVDDDENFLFTTIQANISINKKYFYSKQKINLEFDAYYILPFNNLNQ
jgi:hypothetical protein